MPDTSVEKFLLKDHLFDRKKIKKIACEIESVYQDFESNKFTKKVVDKFPELELMERVHWIKDCLKEHLPDEYREAVDILLRSLPSPCDPSLSDDDFGSFIYSPYSYYVSEYGCEKKDLIFSLKALGQMTTRFSVEGPIRFFINKFPRETLLELSKWARDSHYHVRRLASEGTRPSLPWAKKIAIDHTDAVEILNILHADKTRFVTRSVANHLNDISKFDPDLVIRMLRVWHKLDKQTKDELDYMTRHALRTLVKSGNADALKLLGYNSSDIAISDFEIKEKIVKIGSSVEFSFTVTSSSKKSQKLMIDYELYFRKASGKLLPKTYKISKKVLPAGESICVKKKHPLKVMTTQKLYPGVHKIGLQINGLKFDIKQFKLKT